MECQVCKSPNAKQWALPYFKTEFEPEKDDFRIEVKQGEFHLCDECLLKATQIHKGTAHPSRHFISNCDYYVERFQPRVVITK